MLKEYLDLRRQRKQGERGECIMRILTISILNADRVAVDHFADVVEKFSAESLD
jgi:hypothetical protein